MSEFELTQGQKWWIESRSRAWDQPRSRLREMLMAQRGLCALSEVRLEFGRESSDMQHPLFAELDHIAPGTEDEGLQIICRALNRAKGRLPYFLFMALKETDEWKGLMVRWRAQAAVPETETGYIEALNGLLWPKK